MTPILGDVTYPVRKARAACRVAVSATWASIHLPSGFSFSLFLHFYFSLQFYHLPIRPWFLQWPCLCPHHPVPTTTHQQALPAPEPGGLHCLRSESGFLTSPISHCKCLPHSFPPACSLGFHHVPMSSLWLDIFTNCRLPISKEIRSSQKTGMGSQAF